MKTFIDVASMIDEKSIKSMVKEKKTLCVIIVGDNDASYLYVRNKQRFLEKVGLKLEISKLPTTTSTSDVITHIYQQSMRNDIHGIMVQLPLPTHLDEDAIINAIPPTKDVDGLTDKNMLKLSALKYPFFIPCTARGIMKILDKEGMLHDKTIAIIGRSKLAGRPLASLLSTKQYNDTIMLCHSHTKNLKQICRTADVIITAVGIPDFLNDDYIGKSGVLVIDVGINMHNGKFVGDVDTANIGNEYDVKLTPVPYGVGLLTVESLALNLIDA